MATSTEKLADDSAGMAPLNIYRTLQSVTTRTPEALAQRMRMIRGFIRIEAFTATPGAHTCYFTATKIIKFVEGVRDDGNTGRIEA